MIILPRTYATVPLRNSRNAEVDFVIFNERQTIQGACSMWKGEMTKLLME